MKGGVSIYRTNTQSFRKADSCIIESSHCKNKEKSRVYLSKTNTVRMKAVEQQVIDITSSDDEVSLSLWY